MHSRCDPVIALDLGCGIGVNLATPRNAVEPEGEVLGIDHSPKMVGAGIVLDQRDTGRPSGGGPASMYWPRSGVLMITAEKT